MPYRPSWAHKVPDYARDAQDRWYGTYENVDWNLLRRQGNEWLRYWDTQIRGRGK